jgi:hypothetical protein
MGKESLMTGVLTPAGLAEPSATADEETGGFTRGVSRQTFWEDQKRRVRRGRLIGFAICIPLWMLSMVPLARESMEGREGVLVYLVVGAFTLAVAAVIRGVYVLVTKRPFLSPWIFVMAALVALAGSAVQGAGEVPVADASALESMAA